MAVTTMTGLITSGQVTVSVAGAAVRAGTNKAKRNYLFSAPSGNTGDVFIGDDGSGDVSSTTGLVMAKGGPVVAIRCRLYDLWVDVATGGDKLCWFLSLG